LTLKKGCRFSPGFWSVQRDFKFLKSTKNLYFSALFFLMKRELMGGTWFATTREYFRAFAAVESQVVNAKHKKFFPTFLKN
jgi:hypothetical protein